MRRTRHRWHLGRNVGAEMGLFFRCPCGFAVTQLCNSQTHPQAFIRAVNQHLRDSLLDDQHHPSPKIAGNKNG